MAIGRISAGRGGGGRRREARAILTLSRPTRHWSRRPTASARASLRPLGAAHRQRSVPEARGKINPTWSDLYEWLFGEDICYECLSSGDPEWARGIPAGPATRTGGPDTRRGALAAYAPHQPHCLARLAHRPGGGPVAQPVTPAPGGVDC